MRFSAARVYAAVEHIRTARGEPGVGFGSRWRACVGRAVVVGWQFVHGQDVGRFATGLADGSVRGYSPEKSVFNADPGATESG